MACSKTINKSGMFDSEWYMNRYPDVALTGIDPLEHFCRYGSLLKRHPGPNFDAQFYEATYGDLAACTLSPLEHYASLEEYDSRPTTREAFRNRMREIDDTTSEKWLTQADVQRPDLTISYCIPVMGRLDDLKGTLEFNLRENEIHRKDIEFVVIEFGQTQEVIPWIKENFSSYLADGYLRTIHDTETLDTWHFGKAKNAFRPHAWGRIYSSLDGDNFVTKEETDYLLSLTKEYPDGFVFHHFSGRWGDGTSGRVSMPTSVYRHVGYDSSFLPRQFDEVDLILGSLIELPAMPFIGVSKDRNIFTLSNFSRLFFEREKLGNKREYVEFQPRHRSPLNPRGADYTDKAPHWRDMNNFNASVAALKRGRNPWMKEKSTSQIALHKHKLIESLPADQVLQTLFLVEPRAEISKISPKDLCVLACVKDEEHFLKRFVDHHRSLGASHFLIVDDNSATPVSSLDLGKNVLVVRPKVGDFRNAKTLWLEGLMKAFLPEGVWTCTLDADELLSLPGGYQSLRDVTSRLEIEGKDFATCLLIDMLPAPNLSADKLLRAEEEFDEVFSFLCDRNEPISPDYAGYRSIKWAFGSHADISWRTDARFHAFGTFDSLRKLSMFRYQPHRHLNQGFHSFHYIDGTPSPGHEIWDSSLILPIRHYKLVKLFSEAKRKKMLEIADGYHARTSQNIAQIFGDDTESALQKLAKLSRWLRPVTELNSASPFRLRGHSRNALAS